MPGLWGNPAVVRAFLFGRSLTLIRIALHSFSGFKQCRFPVEAFPANPNLFEYSRPQSVAETFFGKPSEPSGFRSG
jgi:hypothetical protein